MKNIKNNLITKRNNRGLFFQLSFFALFAVLTLFSGQISAQQTCTPSTTVTEGNLFPGGIPSFGVSSQLGTVTIDHVNAGTGTQSLTMVGAPTNAAVSIPGFTAGTFNPVIVAFTKPFAASAVEFTLRAASTYHAINIVVRCPAPPVQGCTRTQGYWKNHEEEWPVQSLTLGTVNYTKAQLLSIFNQPVQGNGLISLAHQLIAAKLNRATTATVPASVATAITNADTMIGGLVAPPVSSGSLSTSSTSSLTSTLDTYNKGETPGGPPHCDD